MRIAVVHSFYSSASPSGENDVVTSQVSALRRAGHDVTLIDWHTDVEERTRGYALRAGLQVATGFGPSPLKQLAEFEPDVVHVHNLFPNAGTRWLRHTDFPVVSSLHNYRQVCANGLLYRDGHGCTECVRSTIHAVQHGCYRDSRLASIPLAIMTRGGAGRSRLLISAQAITVPSLRAWEAFRDFGVAEDRLHLLPYFIDDPGNASDPTSPPGSWILAGRLSAEKGVSELLDIWPSGERLDVAGSGPLESTLKPRGSETVRFLGQLSQKELTDALPGYHGLIFPGRSPEGIPSIVLHALAAGLPVVARAGNGAADLVGEFRLGAVYDSDTTPDMERALLSVRDRGAVLREQARSHFIGNFTEAAWIQRVQAVYRSAIARRDASHPGGTTMQRGTDPPTIGTPS